MSVNYSSSTPVAEAKKKLCKYQTDGTNVSLEFDLDVNVASISSSGALAIAAIETVELVTTSSSNITRTLPAASASSGQIVTVKKIDVGSPDGSVIIQGNGSPAEHIDGLPNYTLSNQYQYVRLLCDGTGWNVIGNN